MNERIVVAAHRILLVIAVVLLFIFGLIGAGVIDSSHPEMFLGFGLTALAASFL